MILVIISNWKFPNNELQKCEIYEGRLQRKVITSIKNTNRSDTTENSWEYRQSLWKATVTAC